MLETLKEIICNYVEVNPDDIKLESRFIEDLSFNSYDFMSMLGDVESEFGVTVDEADVIDLHTVGEAIDYIEKLKG